ncbi:MAG: glycoside hydrolase family 16 protein [Bacteroidetes bacterium]|nr:glycoside hydrolase family 16 protein [Bacteroidota bacterium]
MLRSYLYLISSLVLLFMMNNCTKEENNLSEGDPYDLLVEILTIDLNNNEVTLQALAQNATLYQLYIENDVEPIDANTSGFFSHIFDEPGIYNLTVRAYGSSGRYVKDTKLVELITEQPTDTIPLDKGYFTPLEYDGYELMWNDEFNGNSISSSSWSFELGNGCPANCGWGNSELEYYKSENAWVADSVLTIEAREEIVGSNSYTSARMKTQAKVSFQYGRVDIRALLPKGQGIWPALWMMGNNIASVGWPKCGEIDIMEMIGGNGRENTVHGTIHYDNNGHIFTGDSYTLSSENFYNAYHVFSIIWDDSTIKWYVDDNLYHQENISSPDRSEFHQEFFFLLNLAVGGEWPGNPDSSTTFPQRMKVDYIRVFQLAK